jgi:hypothetical protein
MNGQIGRIFAYRSVVHVLWPVFCNFDISANFVATFSVVHVIYLF